MRHLIAHLLGIDKEVIQERMRSHSMEADMAEMRERLNVANDERKRMKEQYKETCDEYMKMRVEYENMQNRFIAAQKYYQSKEWDLQEKFDDQERKMRSLRGRIGALTRKVKQLEALEDS